MALGMRICHIVIAAQIALSPNLAIAGLVVEPGGSALDPARIAKSPPPKTTGKGQIACYNGFSKHCIGMSPGWNPPDDSMEYLIPSQPSGDTIASIRAQTAAGNYSDSDARPSVEVGLLMRAHLFGPALDAANRELVKWNASYTLLAQRAQIFAHFGEYQRAQADLDAALFWTERLDGHYQYIRWSDTFYDWKNALHMMRAINFAHLDRIAEAQAELAAVESTDRKVLDERDRTADWVQGKAGWTPEQRARIELALRSPIACGPEPEAVLLAERAKYRTDLLFVGRLERDARCGEVDKSIATIEAIIAPRLTSQNGIRDAFYIHDGADVFFPQLLKFYAQRGQADHGMAMFRQALKDFPGVASNNLYYKILALKLVEIDKAVANYAAAADDLLALRALRPIGNGLTYDPNSKEEEWAPREQFIEVAELARLSGQRINPEAVELASDFASGVYDEVSRSAAERANARFEAAQARNHEIATASYDAYVAQQTQVEQLEACNRQYNEIMGLLYSSNTVLNKRAMDAYKGECSRLRSSTNNSSFRFNWEQ